MRAWFAALAVVLSAVAVVLLPGCGGGAGGGKQVTVGVAFETLQTEYWVASFETLKAELAAKDVKVLEAVADGDANRQLDQVNQFITRKVDGIIIAPKDGTVVLPMIKAANKANIPIVLYNRPPAKKEGECVTVVADNFKLTYETVKYMCEQAKKTGKKHKGMILIGDLNDLNGIARRDGFEAAVKEYPDAVEVVARVPTEWNLDRARGGVVNALQANPDISFVFTSSDFLFPPLVTALKGADKYHTIGDPRHVILGGFDGDATAYQMLKDGYLDADGVQDMQFECMKSVEAILKLKAGEKVDEVIRDEGFVIHQGNLSQMADRMWGSKVKK
jgi:ABC-type sugar transport system substrate-binding protein